MVDVARYVDVNVFVYWLGGHPELGERALEWVRRIEAGERGSFVTSSLTIYEVLVILAGLAGKTLRDQVFVEEVASAIAKLSGLRVEPLRAEDVERAVDLMKAYDIDYEDALHLATALRVGAKEIVSNDKDFDKTPLTRVL